ncbi:MAG: M23 family metallopeptidase [Mongoliibacter sp.]|uniref:M23 family metallopeptidase n=1 Tax=Mongoliibacter sp. TaxID=2022438 RepID=UPI0012F09A26|nr:M23 family metallopeptidase [Mongoliibacter sp.]TVP45688.1 MAG: M23 family metallopeptidase [Mongoliibacter sp.]
MKYKLKKIFKSKFLFVIRKEEDFAVLTSFSITASKVLLIGVLFFILSFGISLVLAKTLLKNWFDPSLTATESTELFINLSNRVDSLALEVMKKDNYIQNIQRIIGGDELGGDTVQAFLDTANFEVGSARPELEKFQPSKGTQSIIEEMRGLPLEGNLQNRNFSSFMTSTYFFTPIKGLVLAVFDPQQDHFGVDIVAKENEAVKSILDGTVIFSSWTLDTGYVLMIQHSNELISIYKHNSVILKNVGDVVRSGEIISIVGNTGELSSGPHLHFELWYQGSPLNPQEFISFD